MFRKVFEFILKTDIHLRVKLQQEVIKFSELFDKSVYVIPLNVKSVIEVSTCDTFFRIFFEKNFITCLQAFSRRFMGIRAYFTHREKE